MIRISQLKVDVARMPRGLSMEEEIEALRPRVAKELRVPERDVLRVRILRRSIDARRKERIQYVYALDVEVPNEGRVLSRRRAGNLLPAPEEPRPALRRGSQRLSSPPVVIGFGPAGMFAALELSRAGFRPIVLERGREIGRRAQDAQRFWETGELDEESNVQFGEGGAGAFSDGKLNSQARDPFGRGRKVLEDLVRFGAPREILYDARPHIGTDRLQDVVRNLREEILSLGGEIRFSSKATDFCLEKGRLRAVEVNGAERIPCEAAVLAIGHSARDTFRLLWERGLSMEPKAFAIGLRIAHPQERINISQYGKSAGLLPPADYKVTHRARSGRGIYSFCMCPGGYVVNASSERGGAVTNGMSYSDRGGAYANSAIVVSVTPEDFPGDSPLAGVDFQEKWERAAYREGGGQIPAQTFGGFLRGEDLGVPDAARDAVMGAYGSGNLRNCLPECVGEGIEEGILAFGRKIRGFASEDALLFGVETRTSSPLRIWRGDALQSSREGIYPCGEGAGYAGGILSAAMDGLKVFEAIAGAYAPPA